MKQRWSWLVVAPLFGGQQIYTFTRVPAHHDHAD